ncbi:MAG: hypothetical protein U1F43_37125 [Myxococcota bacterium]
MRAIPILFGILLAGGGAACTGPDVDAVRWACQADDECGAGWSCGDDGICRHAVAVTDPWEICDDCVDNDGDGLTDDATCAYRYPLHVAAPTSGIEAWHAVTASIDHAGWVQLGRSGASGDDVRVVWRDVGSGALGEIDRIVDPSGPTWNLADTRLWFALQAPLAGGAASDDYAILTRVASGSPMAELGAVYSFADLFDREDGPKLGSPWVEHEHLGSVIVKGGALVVATSNPDGIGPIAAARLPEKLASGRWRVHFGFAWSAPADADFGVYLQVGNAKLLDAPTDLGDAASLAANVVTGLVWHAPALTARVPVLALVGPDGEKVIGDLSGAHAVDLIVDLDAKTATVVLDDGRPSASVALLLDSPVTALRIAVRGLDASQLVAHRFDEVSVRHLAPGAEPTVTVLSPVVVPCGAGAGALIPEEAP